MEKKIKVGDTIILNDVEVEVVLAATDNNGHYVCDDGKNKCYFLNESDKRNPYCLILKEDYPDFSCINTILVKKDTKTN